MINNLNELFKTHKYIKICVELLICFFIIAGIKYINHHDHDKIYTQALKLKDVNYNELDRILTIDTTCEVSEDCNIDLIPITSICTDKNINVDIYKINSEQKQNGKKRKKTKRRQGN